MENFNGNSRRRMPWEEAPSAEPQAEVKTVRGQHGFLEGFAVRQIVQRQVETKSAIGEVVPPPNPLLSN